MCIRDRAAGLEDAAEDGHREARMVDVGVARHEDDVHGVPCLLYTSDAADERSSVDLGGRRIIKKKTAHELHDPAALDATNSYRRAHN